MKALSAEKQEAVMIGGSVPKLLQEAGQVKEAMARISEGLPSGFSTGEIEARITALEEVVSAVDALNVERTR